MRCDFGAEELVVEKYEHRIRQCRVLSGPPLHMSDDNDTTREGRGIPSTVQYVLAGGEI